MSIERPANAPSPDHPLLRAARYNDAQVEESMDLKRTLREMGLRFEDVRYVAEQRALRVVLMWSGRLNEMNPGSRYTRPSLSPRERNRIERLIPVYIDAIVLGWRAKSLVDTRSATLPPFDGS